METSPFEHVRPVPPGRLTGRERETDLLVGAMVERRPVTVLAPRRFGKTSLLRHAALLLDEVHHLDTVQLDLYGLASHADFADRLHRAMTALKGPIRRRIDGLLAGTELSLGTSGTGLRYRFASRTDTNEAVSAVHRLLDGLVQSSDGGGLVVALDEFQDIASVERLDALLRTYIQREEARSIGWVFAGSRPSLMRHLFADRGAPFYGQSELMELRGLDDSDAVAIIHDGFDATGRDVGSQAVRIAQVAEGHPQRLMLVADRLWRRVPAGAVATDVDFADGLDDVRAATAPEHHAVVDALTAKQRDTLRAIALDGTPAGRTSGFLDLARSTANEAARVLVTADVVERTAGGRWRTIDPLLGDFLRRLA